MLNCERFYYILNERGVYGDRMAACINDSITKWKFTQTKILKCLLFLLIFQLYFIKEIGNLVPHWKKLKNLPKESATAAYFMHRSCVFQAESLFLPLASCTCHKRINTNIYFCQLLLSNVKFRQRERWDQVFLSEIWKLSNNRQTDDYSSTISRLPIIEKLPINRLISNQLQADLNCKYCTLDSKYFFPECQSVLFYKLRMSFEICISLFKFP